MPLVINTNVSSLNAQRQLTMNTLKLGQVTERLASGFKINRAADDAAGLQVSEDMRATIRGSRKALDNVQDATNMLNTADGALSSMQEHVQRMRELAVQSANGTLSTAQRTALNEEFTALRSEIDRISTSTQFNGVNVLGSSPPTNINIQIGADAGQQLNVGTQMASFNTTTMSVNASVVDTAANASDAILALDNALSQLGTRRGQIGAMTNRLAGISNNLEVSIENTEAAESRVRNADIAKESAELVRYQILQQASASILSQTNQVPSLALKLL